MSRYTIRMENSKSWNSFVIFSSEAAVGRKLRLIITIEDQGSPIK
jgi:hypothetical protein